QCKRIDVRLEVLIVTIGAERVVERIIKPVTGKRHGTVERFGRRRWSSQHRCLRTADYGRPIGRRGNLDPRICGSYQCVSAGSFDDGARVGAGGTDTRLPSKGDFDRYPSFRRVGERVEPAAPVLASIDENRPRDCHAAHVYGLRGAESIDAVEMEAKTTHDL